jgi:hypothetical protein
VESFDCESQLLGGVVLEVSFKPTTGETFKIAVNEARNLLKAFVKQLQFYDESSFQSVSEPFMNSNMPDIFVFKNKGREASGQYFRWVCSFCL